MKYSDIQRIEKSVLIRRQRSMKNILLAPFLLAATLILPDISHAQEEPTKETMMHLEDWNELVKTLAGLPDRMLATLPEKMQKDPQIQQEVLRLALAGLTGSAMGALSFDGDHPFFIPQLTVLTFAGQVNADTLYKFTAITPGGKYRLRGKRGSMRIATIGEMQPYLAVGDRMLATPIRSYHDINQLKVDADDRFDVLLSTERPEGYDGDWWELEPTTNRLLLRMVSSDWGNEREPSISIERIDVPAQRPRPPAEEVATRLRDLIPSVITQGLLFVDKVEQLRAEGYNNRFKVFDVSGMGGLAGQAYYEGPYEIEDDEALLIEAKAPETCHYRSIMVTNETYDTLDWYNNQTSLNDSQSQPDPDGVLRFVLSKRDPGIFNWLDTAGHKRGLVQGRWMNCSSSPTPSAKRVKFDELSTYLHPHARKVTPEERDAILRERRRAVQERVLW